MTGFKGTASHYEILRRALQELHKEGLKEKVLIYNAKLNLHSTSISRFRTGKSNSFKRKEAEKLWNYILDAYPSEHINRLGDAIDVTRHSLLYGIMTFLDAASENTKDKCMPFSGNFQVFSRSEIFSDQNYFVVSQMRCTVASRAGAVILVREQQKYDGSLGLSQMKEERIGYCFQKNGVWYVFLKSQTHGNPIIYIFDRVFVDGVGEERKVQWMSGEIMKSGMSKGVFNSRIYAQRVMDRENLKCAIMSEEELEQFDKPALNMINKENERWF